MNLNGARKKINALAETLAGPGSRDELARGVYRRLKLAWGNGDASGAEQYTWEQLQADIKAALKKFYG